MQYLVLTEGVVILKSSNYYTSQEFWSHFGINGTLDKIVLCYILEV